MCLVTGLCTFTWCHIAWSGRDHEIHAANNTSYTTLRGIVLITGSTVLGAWIRRAPQPTWKFLSLHVQGFMGNPSDASWTPFTLDDRYFPEQRVP
ncbi:hypothetical protein EDB83DRAFT_2410874 [Lactarius deliciosus]|nr:hypothetical protein EDB83DRAFT_2410874 [Lactarius deliciosus]